MPKHKGDQWAAPTYLSPQVESNLLFIKMSGSRTIAIGGKLNFGAKRQTCPRFTFGFASISKPKQIVGLLNP